MAMPAFPLDSFPPPPPVDHGYLAARAASTQALQNDLRALYEDDATWVSFARTHLDTTPEAKRNLGLQVAQVRAHWERARTRDATILQAIEPDLSPEGLAHARLWAASNEESARLAFAMGDLMVALLGRTEGIPGGTLARARKIQFQAAKQDVFTRHDELMRRLA